MLLQHRGLASHLASPSPRCVPRSPRSLLPDRDLAQKGLLTPEQQMPEEVALKMHGRQWGTQPGNTFPTLQG